MKRPRLSREAKEKIRELATQNKNPAVVAKELGLPVSTVSYWHPGSSKGKPKAKMPDYVLPDRLKGNVVKLRDSLMDLATELDTIVAQLEVLERLNKIFVKAEEVVEQIKVSQMEHNLLRQRILQQTMALPGEGSLLAEEKKQIQIPHKGVAQ